MLIDAMKSAGPKMIVSTRGDAVAIASTLIRPSAFSICASIPIRPTSRPTDLLDLGQQQVEGDDLLGGLHLRQHDAVEVGAGALDDLDHVAVRPLRRPVVDPDDADLVAPAAGVERLDDGAAGVDLGDRRDRVLQVEEDLVGVEALGLLQEARVRARAPQGTSGVIAASSGMDASSRLDCR